MGSSLITPTWAATAWALSWRRRPAAPSVRPNAPSFNGQRVRFSLLLAPYAGDELPVELQHAAAAFFYPCGAIYLRTPDGIDALLPDDVRGLVAARQRQARLLSTAPLPPPHRRPVQPLRRRGRSRLGPAP
ncbi:MAG: hypothetical protein H8D78_00860 [Chloroflexi bacterium]|nr:hypothetical protein [Chloroflexota bacterium]